MKGMVNELVAIVGGNASASQSRGNTARHTKPAHARHSQNKALAVSKRPAKGKALSLHRSREVNPDDIIPMDKNDFKDF